MRCAFSPYRAKACMRIRCMVTRAHKRAWFADAHPHARAFLRAPIPARAPPAQFLTFCSLCTFAPFIHSFPICIYYALVGGLSLDFSAFCLQRMRRHFITATDRQGQDILRLDSWTWFGKEDGISFSSCLVVLVPTCSPMSSPLVFSVQGPPPPSFIWWNRRLGRLFSVWFVAFSMCATLLCLLTPNHGIACLPLTLYVLFHAHVLLVSCPSSYSIFCLVSLCVCLCYSHTPNLPHLHILCFLSHHLSHVSTTHLSQFSGGQWDIAFLHRLLLLQVFPGSFLVVKTHLQMPIMWCEATFGKHGTFSGGCPFLACVHTGMTFLNIPFYSVFVRCTGFLLK